jgi:hypothetical protein
MTKHSEIIKQVQAVYQWLDEMQSSRSEVAGACRICGKCCDFETYGHRLYVAAPEIVYFADKVGSENIKQMADGRCCYQVDGKCTVYRYRFAGCRVFCCKGDAAFQSELTESAVKKFKSICEKFKIPYRYIELAKALEQLAVERTQDAS